MKTYHLAALERSAPAAGDKTLPFESTIFAKDFLVLIDGSKEILFA
jgi:hypothetical protein